MRAFRQFRPLDPTTHSYSIGKQLKNIINKDIETNEVPALWKIFLVIPIPKIANTVKYEDFRPINILPLSEKLWSCTLKID